MIGITSGDPAGIGPEVVERWLATAGELPVRLRLFGPVEWTERVGSAGGHSGLGVGRPDYRAIPGRPDEEGATLAWNALRRAADSCRTGEIDAVVTGPISKAALAAVGFEHPGQTEFFAAAWGGEPVMGFTGGRLRVALATWHLPLGTVPRALTPEGLDRAVRAAHELAAADGIARPRLVVCGLNPHASEKGLFGNEERDLIIPAMRELERVFGPGFFLGPFPPDTVFVRALEGEFDGVVAHYHDQGLIPFKLLHFKDGVNVTVGLPLVRTSVDHGTAYDIAGQGRADCASLAAAASLAAEIVDYRTQRGS